MVNLRAFALIFSTHPYCACNSRRNVIPCHALSARASYEMWAFLISMHDHFLCRLSMFYEKLKKICVVEV